MKRTKVAKMLLRVGGLLTMLEKARRVSSQGVAFDVEETRLRRVILKLARGHCLHELSEPHFEEPVHLSYGLLDLLPTDKRSAFEALPTAGIWPEVGSRAMQRLAISGENQWVQVQAGRYRYAAFVAESVTIRMVLSEYLAAEVIW
jgi:hypothetical protein